MIADRFDSFLSAVNDVQHTFRQSRLAKQFRDAAGGKRHLLARLQDHAVAEGDGVGDGPVGHHVGEIERSDRRDDADRESFDAAFNAAADLQHLAGCDLRKRAREFRQLRTLQDLRARLAVDLSVFFGDQRGELVNVLLQERFVTKENLHALLDRKIRPGRKCALGGLNCPVDRRRRRERNSGDDAAAGRIGDVEKVVAFAVDERAADVISDRGILRADVDCTHKRAMYAGLQRRASIQSMVGSIARGGIRSRSGTSSRPPVFATNPS